LILSSLVMRKLERKEGDSKTISLVVLTAGGFILGASHQILAATFSFALLIWWVHILSQDTSRKWRGVANLSVLSSAFSCGVISNFLSGYALSRLGFMAEIADEKSVMQEFATRTLDSIWTALTLISIPFLAALLFGGALALVFRFPSHKSQYHRKLILWSVLFFLYVCAVMLVLGWFSYSAPWHLFTPRLAIQVVAVLLGVEAGLHLFRNFELRALGLTSSALLLTTLTVLTVSWSSTLPDRWANGPLPVKTVKEGLGSGVSWADTDDARSKKCYYIIHPILKDRKSP
jgi:hypothetical protein